MPETKDVIANPDLVEDLLDEETGRRKPKGFGFLVLLLVPVIWSLFQLWITSPLPYSVGIGVLNDTASRSLHLGFAIFLAYLGFPMFKKGLIISRSLQLRFFKILAFLGFSKFKNRLPVKDLVLIKKSPSNYIPALDWVMALAAAFCAVYLYIFQDQLARRPGIPTTEDIIVACVGMVLLLEATRRVMGLPMTIVAMIFLAYVFLGNSMFVPDIIAHKGASLSRAASQFWLTQEGVFGVPLGVSTSFVFLFVLFGAMLERAGAGNYLTALSFALLGHLRGGPAKAAVVASGLHGLISGSSIANVLTCGPVTIMLMKKVGFSAEKAGAVEVAAGSNGQIMPPVMGAAAFLMAEYIGMPYAQLIKHAFVPAILAYSSLLYIVHIEACKMGMVGLPRAHQPWAARLIRWGLSVSALLIVMGGLYYLTAWIPRVFGGYAWLVFALMLAAGYIGMLFLSLKVPELPEDTEALMNLPAALPILFSGLYFLLPIATLVWGLMVLEMSPGLAAYYACLFMAFIILTQRPFVAWLRKQAVKPAIWEGLHRLYESLGAGARNMVGIGLATASAGIVVGAVSLTGVGQVLGIAVEEISGGYLPAVLVMTALLAIVLGMGLPTTANYIIVSTLLAPVITNLSAGYGLYIPPLAVHMFCLYFGVMADATPPVALAAFAASGISGGDPFKTGVQGFIYELRTAVLPFVFIYNQEIILLGVKNIFHFLWVLVTAALACMAFASFTQRYMFTKARWWEMILLFVATVFLFRPDIPQDLIYPPYRELPPAQVMGTVAELEPGQEMRLHLLTRFEDGRVKDQVVVLPFKGEKAEERLESIGAVLAWEGDKLMIDDVLFNSRLEKLKVNMEDPTEVLGVEVLNPRPDKWMFSSPGLFILGVVVISQIRRSRREKPAAAPALGNL